MAVRLRSRYRRLTPRGILVLIVVAGIAVVIASGLMGFLRWR